MAGYRLMLLHIRIISSWHRGWCRRWRRRRDYCRAVDFRKAVRVVAKAARIQHRCKIDL